MSSLTASDLEAGLELSRHASTICDLESFREELLPAIRRLIASDTLGYNEIDFERRHAVVITDAPAFEGIDQRFLDLSHQHPMVPHQHAGDLRARLISDTLTARAFHRLELYGDIYRPLGIEDQLAFGLSVEGVVAINLGRSARTFTERDRAMAELARPHLALAYRRAHARERRRALLKAAGQALESGAGGALLLSPDGAVADRTALAEELLVAYFGELPPNQLPEQLHQWLDTTRGASADQRLTVEGPRGRLRIHQAPAQALVHWRILMLQEQRAVPPRLESLNGFGLTCRQAQVLRLAASGRRSRQIGAELGLSPATVHKHLERSYRRLGVTSLAEALAHLGAAGN